MAIILSIWSVILALGVWQEKQNELQHEEDSKGHPCH